MKKIFATIITSLSLVALMAQGDSHCRNFACTDYTQGKVFVFEEGEIVWEHDAPLSNDLWILGNGNLLFTTGKGVLEVTPQKDTVFHYSSQSSIFACQRLENGRTFVGECSGGRLLELNRRGKIVKEISIVQKGNKSDDGYIRNARRLDNGHYLVAHYSGRKAVEYDAKGRIVWEVSVEGGAHSVVRLANGNTLVAATDKTRDPKILEFDKAGEVVWELSNKDLEGEPLKFMSGFQYLPESDSFLLTNWQGHNVKEKGPHIIHVGRDKKIIGTLSHHDRITTVSSIFVESDGSKTYH